MTDLVDVFIQRMRQRAEDLSIVSHNMLRLADICKEEGLDVTAKYVNGLKDAYAQAANVLCAHIEAVEAERRVNSRPDG